MKKHLSLILAIIMMLSLWACASKNEGTSVSETEETKEYELPDENRYDICSQCLDDTKPTSYRDDYIGYYCDDCYADGSLKSCNRCGKLFEETFYYEAFPADVPEYFCKECYAKAAKCSNCEDITKKTAYYEDIELYFCDECYGDGNVQVCDDCHKICDKLINEVYKGHHFENVCQKCFEKSIICQFCEDPSKEAEPRDGFWYFVCDGCLKENSICESCHDPSKKTSYRYEYYFYYCDDCYGDGSKSECTLCAKLVDYELYEWTEEDFICHECYAEWDARRQAENQEVTTDK